MLWCISESNWFPSLSHPGTVLKRRPWAPACSSHGVEVQWVAEPRLVLPCHGLPGCRKLLVGVWQGDGWPVCILWAYTWTCCISLVGVILFLIIKLENKYEYIFLPRHTSVSSPAFSPCIQWNNSLWVKSVDRCQLYDELPWSFCTHWQPQCSCVFPSLLLVSKPWAPCLLCESKTLLSVGDSIWPTASFPSLSSKVLKNRWRYFSFFFCLLLHFPSSSLRAEPWLKTLRAETQEVAKEKKKSWSRSLLPGSMEQRKRLKLHNCESELCWTCCVRILYDATVFRGAQRQMLSHS